MQNKEQFKQIIHVLWFALLASNGIIVFVAHSFMFKGGEGTGSKEIIDIITGLAVLFLFASKLVYKKAISSELNFQRSFVFYILSWALAESATIFGLIYGVLGGEQSYQFAYFFFIMAILVHLSNRPKVA